VRVQNKGTAACTMTGRPVLTGRRGGRTLTIPIGLQERDLMPGAVPATIEPGEAADLEILTYGGCLDGRPETVYTAVRLRFADGGTMSLGEDLNATCGVNVGAWHRLAPEPVDPLAGMELQIAAPATIRPGENLDFVVTLVNPTPRDIPLDPCPNYSVILESTVKIVGSHALNCVDAGGQPRVVPSGMSLSFGMRLPIPADPGLTAGPKLLRWSLTIELEVSVFVTVTR
jgi:hypothetical protein